MSELPASGIPFTDPATPDQIATDGGPADRQGSVQIVSGSAAGEVLVKLDANPGVDGLQFYDDVLGTVHWPEHAGIDAVMSNFSPGVGSRVGLSAGEVVLVDEPGTPHTGQTYAQLVATHDPLTGLSGGATASLAAYNADNAGAAGSRSAALSMRSCDDAVAVGFDPVYAALSASWASAQAALMLTSDGTDGSVSVRGTKHGFYGATPVARATITGSRSAATVSVLTQLLAALANLGLIVNSTTP